MMNNNNKLSQKQYQLGQIVKFKSDASADVAVFDFLYNKRTLVWKDHYKIENQLGIILEIRSIENTIKPEYQPWYLRPENKDNYKPYLWFCFKTGKTYLMFQCEM